MRAIAAAALLLLPSASAASPPPAGTPDAGPRAHSDGAEGGTPLDLFGTRFGPTARGDLELVMRTHAPWQPDAVDPARGRMLCVWLRSDGAPTPSGRVCAVPDTRAPSGVRLRHTTLDQTGARVAIRELPTVVRRPRPTMISATFSPGLLRLAPGRYAWQARTVTDGVEDRLPNGLAEVPLRIPGIQAGRPTTRISSLRCFGAPSRDPGLRCVDPRLRRTVLPTPDDAVVGQNSPCRTLPAEGLLSPCEFGLPAAAARATVALVGDSHASHWRAALEVAAQRRGWRGVSITRSGCTLSRARPRLETQRRSGECILWNQQLPQWLARHPEVRTVFVVGHVAAKVDVPPSADALATKITGFRAAWKGLPPSVTRIVVIRDTPIAGRGTLQCVRRERLRRSEAGRVCARPRSIVLNADPAVVAARGLRSRHVKVVDMTRYFCSPRRCFPVVGGALVYKDEEHLTDVFATTLGPYLLKASERA